MIETTRDHTLNPTPKVASVNDCPNCVVTPEYARVCTPHSIAIKYGIPVGQVEPDTAPRFAALGPSGRLWHGHLCALLALCGDGGLTLVSSATGDDWQPHLGALPACGECA